MFLQSKSLSTPWKYYDENIIEEEQKILQELNIDKSKKIISIFPNMDWDSTNVGIDDAFEDSYDFLEKIEEKVNQILETFPKSTHNFGLTNLSRHKLQNLL